MGLTRIVGQVVLIAGMAALPLVFTNSALDPVLPIRLVLVSGTLAASLALFAFSNESSKLTGLSFNYSRIIVISIILYIGANIASATWAHTSSESVQPMLTAVLFGLMVYTFGLYLASNTALRDLMAARSASDWRGMIGASESAGSWCGEFDHTSTPVAWYSGEAHLNLNEPEAALQCYREAYLQNPYHVHVLNNLAAVYEMKGEHESAIRYFDEALDVMPNFEETIINLAAAYYNSRRYREAHETISKLDGRETTDQRYEHFKRVIEERLEQE